MDTQQQQQDIPPTYRTCSSTNSSNPTLAPDEKLINPVIIDTHPRPTIYQRLLTPIRNEANQAKQAALEIIHFLRHHHWKQTFRIAFQPKYWGWWLLLLVIIILSSLLSSYHTKLAMYLMPYQAQIRHASWSWIVPTILLIIVSFPPLFGHELIILVAGMIWGLWIGFAIACAGTFLGEIMTYYAFKYLIGARSARIEAGSVTYASLAKLMREGGLLMVILVRASAMPGHVCTAMQATIGIGLPTFALACLLTLPKQFALVYLGMLLADPGLDPNDPLQLRASNSNSKQNLHHHQISAIVFLLTALFTILAAYILWMRLRIIRPLVQLEFDRRHPPNLDPKDITQHQQEEEKIAHQQHHQHPLYSNHTHSHQHTPTPIYTHPLAV